MVNTFVVAPNFTMAPPPLIPRKPKPQPADPETKPASPEPKPADADPKPAADAESAPDPWAETVKIQLGDILAKPFGAEWRPLNRYDRTPIAWKHVEEPANHGGFKETRGRLFEGRLGVWASLLAAIGIGASVNIGVYLQSKSDEEVEVKSLETHTIDVTDDIVKDALKSKGVQDHLKKDDKAYLYIISGLKVAKGAKQSVESGFEAGGDLSAADASNNLVNVKVGKLLWKRSKKTSFETATDFIMAAQLRRIILNEKKELVEHKLSLTKTTMEDGTPVVKTDKGPDLEYAGLEEHENDLSAEKDIFTRYLYEERGKPREVDTQGREYVIDEASDYVVMPNFQDDEEDEDEEEEEEEE
ncbi:hypothetical protein B0T25DRAFT_518469 [Lasiosphaeria hispida]|uniref:Uncharacterized protein n=1 Tax=Lasiosphaeria hispida TaxID=260671 RepID=A0AAJ0MEE8_9PEZI|nr:hypothetical protein B0T25DRAFT_518469 [Lasiosphaeria hispida]